jgi:alpha-L-fucosidase
MHVHYWPGETVVLGNLLNKVKSVRLLGSNQPVKFEQNEWRVKMTGLPRIAPALVTTLALECEGVPLQDHELKRAQKPREGKY